MSVNPFEFQQARVKQVVFKSRLRSVLYGVREADPELCALPKNPLHLWLEQVITPRFPNLPELAHLRQTLQRMLNRCHVLQEHYRHGRIEEARTGLGSIETDASEIDNLLSALEKRIGEAAAEAEG